MPQRQDYLLRLLEELGQFLAEILRFRKAGSYDAALFTVLRAQERLFARPAPEFVTRSLEEQIRLLVIGETDANARDKCLAYATLLAEAGHTYQVKEQAALARGAYQLALQVILLIAEKFSPGALPGLQARVASILDRAGDAELGNEVSGLLEELKNDSRTGSQT